MTTALPPRPGAGAPTPHKHDLRVDPSQVIALIGDEMRIRVECAVCRRVGHVYSKPKRAVNPADISTWRRLSHEPGDAIRLEGSGPGNPR